MSFAGLRVVRIVTLHRGKARHREGDTTRVDRCMSRSLLNRVSFAWRTVCRNAPYSLDRISFAGSCVVCFVTSHVVGGIIHGGGTARVVRCNVGSRAVRWFAKLAGSRAGSRVRSNARCLLDLAAWRAVRRNVHCSPVRVSFAGSRRALRIVFVHAVVTLHINAHSSRTSPNAHSCESLNTTSYRMRGRGGGIHKGDTSRLAPMTSQHFR